MSTPTSFPQRLALDLQRALGAWEAERLRTGQLMAELERQQAELDRLRHSVHRESNSRLLAEEALDESRDRLELAVEAAGLALWDWHLTSPNLFMTARWGEMIGDVAMDGYWDAKTVLERVHPDDRVRAEQANQALIHGQSRRQVCEYRVRSANGWLWVESHGMVAEHDNRGRPIRLMGTLADIGERKRAQAQTQHARELAEQASRAKTEFLANMSHEIRTPLNALMGLTQLLMGSPLDEEQTSWLKLMDQSAHALLAMLNDVLDLSRIEAGKMEVEQVPFDLRQLFNEVQALYTAQARNSGVRWDASLATEVPASVVGDPGRLRQIMVNLISNALKFTPTGGHVRMSGDVQASADGARQLVLRVSDSGIGIAPAQQAAIFDAFTQADSSTARRFGGSGLGLAICAKLVQLMDGRIAVRSAPGQGSTFTVTLPLQPEQADTMSPPPVTSRRDDADAVAQAGERFAGWRVLVAEDNAVNELLIRQWLQRLGCTVTVARDGEQAVSSWAPLAFDLVLMDMQMPNVSGLEATRRIRAREREQGSPQVPVIAVTANALDSDRQACLAAGMNGFLSKPMSPGALVRAMDAVRQTSQTRTPHPVPAPHGAHTRPPSTKSESMDLDKLRRRLDGDESTLQQLCKAMQMDLKERLAQLEHALVQQDQGLTVAHAHGLKGSLGSMTAERGARLAKGLELAAQSNDWSLFSKVFPLLVVEARSIDHTLKAVITPPGSGD